MANRSEDEWSLMSSDEEVLSDTSYDEVESEPDVLADTEPEVVHALSELDPLASRDHTLEAPSTTNEATDVQSLLADTSVSERSAAGCSREIRISLLAPAHQKWFAGTPPRFSLASTTTDSFKRNIKLAFAEYDVRPRSFPGRLRAITAATRPLTKETEQPTYTEVTLCKQDQSTQTEPDCDSPWDTHDTRATLLRSALNRSMSLANQLHSKSQDNERLSIRLADLESAIVQTDHKAQRNAMKAKFTERGLVLAKQQAKLSAEYQDNLKTIADDLRRENAHLEAHNAALRGEDPALAVCCVDRLEALESALARGLDQVRAALRAKYRAAMEKRREKEVCVVCFAQPVSVVLLPCRHRVLCAPCAVRVTTCPIDRKDIQDKVLTFGLNVYTDNES